MLNVAYWYQANACCVFAPATSPEHHCACPFSLVLDALLYTVVFDETSGVASQMAAAPL